MTYGRTLLPTDFRDYLSIISFFGFLAIFFEFTLGRTFLSQSMTPIFLIVGGAGLMIVGKVFNIKTWIRDGVQQNEVAQIFAIIFGLTSVVIGGILLTNLAITASISGFIGFLALAPAGFIFIDYLAKNT